MSVDYQKLRLDGVYQQDAEGRLMLRIKVPAGVLSAPQAETVADLAERFAGGRLHLTTRGSIELHGLRLEQIPEALRGLAAVGLTSRGACGGAVRGISCSTTFGPGFAACQVLARRLNRHFAGNPHFEGLPKKFKIGVDGGYDGSRHLIQDIGLVLAGQGEEGALFDVWCAGGLGREPQAGFLLERSIPEEELIPLVEAVIRIYREHVPPPRRLKFLLREIGEERFRELLAAERSSRPSLPAQASLDGALTLPEGPVATARVFAGELDSGSLRELAQLAAEEAGGFLALTADQDVALRLAAGADLNRVEQSLAGLDLAGQPGNPAALRVCPGSHECRVGLAPTRDVARQLLEVLGDRGRRLTFAVSGCPNSCSQPQLADIGIAAGRLQKTEAGREPRFTLYRRSGTELGSAQATDLTLAALLQELADIG